MCGKVFQCKHRLSKLHNLDNRCDSLFGDGKPFSFVNSSLFMGFTKPPETQMESAPKISNLIQPMGFKDWKRTHHITEIMQICMANLPAQDTINHLKSVRSPLWDLWPLR